MNTDNIRDDQRAFHNAEARRSTLRKRPAANVLKGHEAFLKALEQSGATVEFEKASSGEKVIGKIKTSDKYTVSLAVPTGEGEQYVTRVLFKHDISEFSTISRIVAPTNNAELH